jgi:hypothetical protein
MYVSTQVQTTIQFLDKLSYNSYFMWIWLSQYMSCAKLHRAIKQFMQTHNNVNVAFFCHAYSAELQCIVAVCDVSTQLHWRYRHHQGVVIAIIWRQVPSNLSKSMDPNEFYGNAIVLTILKDVVNNVYLSVSMHVDVILQKMCKISLNWCIWLTSLMHHSLNTHTGGMH